MFSQARASHPAATSGVSQEEPFAAQATRSAQLQNHNTHQTHRDVWLWSFSWNHCQLLRVMRCDVLDGKSMQGVLPVVVDLREVGQEHARCAFFGFRAESRRAERKRELLRFSFQICVSFNECSFVMQFQRLLAAPSITQRTTQLVQRVQAKGRSCQASTAIQSSILASEAEISIWMQKTKHHLNQRATKYATSEICI